MEKLRVKSKNEYNIEVNDNGDYITFDLTDVNLPLKLMDCYYKILDLKKEFENRIKVLNEANAVNPENLLNENSYMQYKELVNFYKKGREAVDLFIGENGCQKIFGDKNYADMFNDLFEQLEPHFQKMNLNFKNMKKQLKEKYSISNNRKI